MCMRACVDAKMLSHTTFLTKSTQKTAPNALIQEAVHSSLQTNGMFELGDEKTLEGGYFRSDW